MKINPEHYDEDFVLDDSETPERIQKKARKSAREWSKLRPRDDYKGTITRDTLWDKE
jgi:hypothetical protein